jgi:hypothetical protein
VQLEVQGAQMTRLDVLKSELSAIDRLNRFYWQVEEPDRYERLGYLVRQDRRLELITEMLRLMQSKSCLDREKI